MKELGFGLIGAGNFGKHYIRLLNGTRGAKLKAVAAKTQQTLSEITLSLPKNCKKTTDAQTIFEDNSIGAVIIATPFSTHFDLAMNAINAGKHVLLEKPMVQGMDQANRLKKALAGKNIAFMVGHQYIYNDNVNFIKSMLKKNFFGQPRFFIAEHLYFGQKRTDAGCFWDAGTHQLAVLQYLFNPGKTTSIFGQSIGSSSSGLDDFTFATATFENGLTASFLVSSISQYKSRKFTIIGGNGSAFFDDYSKSQKLEFLKQPVQKSLGKNSKPVPAQKIISLKPEINEKEPLKNQLEHFIHCIKNNKMPNTGIDESLVVAKWLQEISGKIKLQSKPFF